MSMIIKDSYIDRRLIEAVRATWPEPNDNIWHSYANGKRASRCSSPMELPYSCQQALLAMSECRTLIDVLGVPATSFPDWSLTGAGLHQMDEDCSLDLHRDADFHQVKGWRREATMILYLDDTAGGELDLTNASGEVQYRAAARLGRIVAFLTPRQWHRVNLCRSLRRSLCLFWWSQCEKVDGSTRAVFKHPQEELLGDKYDKLHAEAFNAQFKHPQCQEDNPR